LFLVIFQNFKLWNKLKMMAKNILKTVIISPGFSHILESCFNAQPQILKDYNITPTHKNTMFQTYLLLLVRFQLIKQHIITNVHTISRCSKLTPHLSSSSTMCTCPSFDADISAVQLSLNTQSPMLSFQNQNNNPKWGKINLSLHTKWSYQTDMIWPTLNYSKITLQHELC